MVSIGFVQLFRAALGLLVLAQRLNGQSCRHECHVCRLYAIYSIIYGSTQRFYTVSNSNSQEYQLGNKQTEAMSGVLEELDSLYCLEADGPRYWPDAGNRRIANVLSIGDTEVSGDFGPGAVSPQKKAYKKISIFSRSKNSNKIHEQ